MSFSLGNSRRFPGAVPPTVRSFPYRRCSVGIYHSLLSGQPVFSADLSRFENPADIGIVPAGFPGGLLREEHAGAGRIDLQGRPERLQRRATVPRFQERRGGPEEQRGESRRGAIEGAAARKGILGIALGPAEPRSP